MAFNPFELMKLKERFAKFGEQHPKFLQFFQVFGGSAMQEGTVIEITLQAPGEEAHTTNIRLTADDIETLKMLANLKP